MYDKYARELIALIPNLPEIDIDVCRRALSAAYFYVTRSHLSIRQDDFSQQDLRQVRLTLRGLGDALESVAVFDKLNDVERTAKEESASAFVAAEALFLLALLADASKESYDEDPLRNESYYVLIESALLYMIGGYDINAASVVRLINVHFSAEENTNKSRHARLTNSFYVLDRIIAFCCGRVRYSKEIKLAQLDHLTTESMDYETLLNDVRARFCEKLGRALDAYLDWLGGYRSNGYIEAIEILKSIRAILTEEKYLQYNVAFADIHHLTSILHAAIEQTRERALIYNVPRPTIGDAEIIQDVNKYLYHRARGSVQHQGRPFLWPSSLEYIENCLPGPSKDAVIAMPTGSGKSFIAELAIIHALCTGWVLYLAPTNALTHQVRRELKYALEPLQRVDVHAFVGAEEYTTLAAEQVSPEARHFVAVMTPEKCALAMRLYPERFAECTLCVFDECHLLNDEQRGVTADILLAQLCIVAPKAHFLLMSAMLSNPGELAEWLNRTHGSEAVAPPLKWRPSRTMRGLLLLDQESLDTNYEYAKSELAKLSERRKNYKFQVSLAMIAGLSGPWTKNGPVDYRATRLPISFTSSVSRKFGKADEPQFDSWKNTAARLLSELLCGCGLPSLCFILTSRHHAFSSADKVTARIPGAIGQDCLPELVEAWLKIADAELGVETALRKLLRNGIAVHTSAMLQPEQAASEWMFRERKALLMFATPTLAQGLNLPAIGVVIAGTSMGDPRQIDRIDGISRVNALILNGFGRAGRPGFSNQGLAILVSDQPFKARIVPQLDPALALRSYNVLGEEDAAIEVRSPIKGFLDHLLGEDLVTGATAAELALMSLLAEYESEDHNAGQILSHTLAAHQNRHQLSPELFRRARERIAEIKVHFLQRPNVPNWINHAAMKAGVDFFRTWHMWLAYQQHGLITTEQGQQYTVIDWFDKFFDIMARLPPRDVRMYFADEEIKTPSILTRLRDKAQGKEQIDTIPWDAPQGWTELWQSLKTLVSMYMQGKSYAEIARSYKELPKDEIMTNSRNSGTHPIPAVFSFLRKIVDPLAIDAGCFLAIQELAIYEESTSMPDALQSLPLCIRNGCNSLGVLSWYRFGYRERVCAHAFQSVLPMPLDLTDDNARAKWVKDTLNGWLSSAQKTKDYPVLDYAMTVIREGAAL